MVTIAVVALAALAVVLLRYRAPPFTTFDPEVADVSGVSMRARRRAAHGRAGGVDPRDDAGPRA